MFDLASLQTSAVAIAMSVVVGLAVLVVGYAVAVVVESILRKAFAKAELEKKIKDKKLSHALLGFTFTGIIVGLIKWIVFLWFLTSAVGIMENSFLSFRAGAEPVLTNFLVKFAGFLPVLLEGVIILVIGLLIAEYLSTRIKAGVRFQAGTISLAVKALIIYFTVVTLLSNPVYGLDVGVITTIFNYLVLSGALGIGGGIAIAVGLGMKDSVSRLSKKHERGFEKTILGE